MGLAFTAAKVSVTPSMQDDNSGEESKIVKVDDESNTMMKNNSVTVSDNKAGQKD